ncbi:MAG: hypothetical protein IPN71_18610 [Fibrobacteres bacterium]|nr:hypothetical protein [Fibrobacterota bacterium]
MIIQNEFYRFELPLGWKNLPSKSGKAYFEDETGDFGLFSCAIKTENNESDESISKSIMETQKNTYFALSDCSWEVISDSTYNQDGFWFHTLEIFERTRSYRIAAKCITKNKISVQAIFHDYDCKGLEESSKLSTEIFNSLKHLL